MKITPDQCKEARQRLGLSATQMATALGLSDGRAVRRYEADAEAAVADRRPRGTPAMSGRDRSSATDGTDGPAPIWGAQ